MYSYSFFKNKSLWIKKNEKFSFQIKNVIKKNEIIQIFYFKGKEF